MKKKELKGIFISPKEDGTNEIIVWDTMVDELEQMYAKLDCSCIDIQKYKIGNAVVDVVMDDEAKINGKAQRYCPSIMLQDDRGNFCDAVFGKCFICKGNNEDGCLESLNEEEINEILNKGLYQLKDKKNDDKPLVFVIAQYNYRS